jgi:hypothetical protein
MNGKKLALTYSMGPVRIGVLGFLSVFSELALAQGSPNLDNPTVGVCMSCSSLAYMPGIPAQPQGLPNGLLGYVSKWEFTNQAASVNRLIPGLAPSLVRERRWCVNPFLTVSGTRPTPASPSGPIKLPAPWITPFTLWLHYAGSGALVGSYTFTGIPGVEVGTTIPIRLSPGQCGVTVGGILPALEFRGEPSNPEGVVYPVKWAPNPWVDALPAPTPGPEPMLPVTPPPSR